MFSAILPSYLKHYKGQATDPEGKLKRAIESVLSQTFKEYELIVVSDGCEKTIEIASQYDLNLYESVHHGGYGGPARNIGIQKAIMDWIIYIDSDDFWGRQHLEKVVDGMCACGDVWFYWNDWIYNNDWQERQCRPKVKGSCGTANFTHKRSVPIKWDSDYLHDWKVIQQLNKYPGSKIPTTEYFTLHIPNRIDL